MAKYRIGISESLLGDSCY